MNGAVSATLIASRFLDVYYKTLHDYPDQVNGFYDDDSVFVRVEEGQTAPTEPILGQLNIHNKIQSLGYEKCKVIVDSVEAQYSVDSSVVVMLTGRLHNKGGVGRNFAQTIVLARPTVAVNSSAAPRYYVRNDIMRYLPTPAAVVLSGNNALATPNATNTVTGVPVDALRAAKPETKATSPSPSPSPRSPVRKPPDVSASPVRGPVHAPQIPPIAVSKTVPVAAQVPTTADAAPAAVGEVTLSAALTAATVSAGIATTANTTAAAGGDNIGKSQRKQGTDKRNNRQGKGTPKKGKPSDGKPETTQVSAPATVAPPAPLTWAARVSAAAAAPAPAPTSVAAQAPTGATNSAKIAPVPEKKQAAVSASASSSAENRPQSSNVASLYVAGYPENVSESDLTALFDKYGKIENVTVKHTYTLIKYKNADAIESVLTACPFTLQGNPLIVKRDEPPKQGRRSGGGRSGGSGNARRSGGGARNARAQRPASQAKANGSATRKPQSNKAAAQ